MHPRSPACSAAQPSPELSADQEAHARTRAALRDLEAAAARFVPPDFLRLLGAARLADLAPGDAVERKMTILFSDIRDFTPLCEGMTPRDTFRFINSFLGAMEPVVAAHHGFVDKYIGDAVMALFPGGADDAVAAGVGFLGALDVFNQSRGRAGRPRIRIGVGLNHGMVMLGAVGHGERLSGTVVSDAVNLAARLEPAPPRGPGRARGEALPRLPGPGLPARLVRQPLDQHRPPPDPLAARAGRRLAARQGRRRAGRQFPHTCFLACQRAWSVATSARERARR